MDMRSSPSSLAGPSTPDESAAPPTLSEAQRKALVAGAFRSLHVARNSTKANVYLVEWPPQSGHKVAFKDGSNRALWFSFFVGRYQMRREWKAMSALQGMEGVPCPYFRAGADAFGMEWFQGQSLLHFAPGELPAAAVEQLEAVMNEMHSHSVTHGDLHRDNILFDPASGRVCLIDWATSCVFRPKRRGFKAWMWREWQALDRRALAKIKARYTPDLLREEELSLLENGGTPLSRAVRRVGSLFKRRKRTRKEAPTVTPSQASEVV
ncbi:hypothetical protein EON83_23285 [bacterium]|nr:MAG: hypothetical protein EON83_23285 [bacterium]